MRAGATVVLLAILLSSCREQKVVVPAVFRVKFETSQGDIVVEAIRAWAPRGVDRFHELVRMGYFTQGRFFRVVPQFIVQFGVHRDYDVHTVWRNLVIVDDPPQQKNLLGTLAFAQSGKNTRATEIFINLNNNAILDEQGFVPFAKVVEGLEVLNKFYAGYGDLRPKGKFIDPGALEEGANAYLIPRFPKLDYIKRASILK
ncbi:MAG: peptidylprolyl isomerase [Acidobacteriia bacterium]|nr:peptidylprolyl isomerase [Terriglobia bacterium]